MRIVIFFFEICSYETCSNSSWLFSSQTGDGRERLSSSTHPFQLGDEVIADTTPGVHSQHSCGIDRALIVEVGEQYTKVRKIGLDRNCVTTVPNRLLSPLQKWNPRGFVST